MPFRQLATMIKPKVVRQQRNIVNVYRNYEQLFVLGQSAFRDGIAMNDGPYELADDHSHYDAWVDGWQHAQASQLLPIRSVFV